MSASDASFVGFEPLDANYIYCPNQLFDVLMPHCSRGCFRLIVYLLRTTLGWLDQNGEPINQNIEVSWKELIEKAGVSRGALRTKLDEAIRCGAIVQNQAGRSKQYRDGGSSAQYSLRWGSPENYVTAPQAFNGFFSGEGHRTPVPNAFFDQTVPNESLAVTKVVGSVLRHTIGYQNQFGGRRMTTSLSYRQIAEYANLSTGKTLAQAIDQATTAGYVELVDAGRFSNDRQQQRASCYGIRWLKKARNEQVGSEPPSEDDRSKKRIRKGSENPSEDRFRKPTTRKTLEKDTTKQQAAAIERATVALVEAGCDERSAASLVRKRGVEAVERQLEWIDARNPRDSRIGMLCKAIDEDWPMPTAIHQKENRRRIRERDLEADSRKLAEEARIADQKRARAARKQSLLAIWNSASPLQRESWIRRTVKSESSRMIAEIIRRETPQTTTPHVHVLDTVAKENNMPTVTTGTPMAGERSSPDQQRQMRS